MTKRIAIGTLVFSVCMFMGWYSGIDLTERGFLQAWLAASSIVLGVLLAAFAPGGQR